MICLDHALTIVLWTRDSCFCSLDHGAYNLMWIKEGDKKKTAFNTQDGLCEYMVVHLVSATLLQYFNN